MKMRNSWVIELYKHLKTFFPVFQKYMFHQISASNGSSELCLTKNSRLSMFWKVDLVCYVTLQDDIGEKSVFMFNALPEEGKKALIEKLESLNYGGSGVVGSLPFL